MEKKDFLKNLKNIFFKKKILVTGHTGFKGSWLSLWLLKLGAKVYGISNNIPTKPSHYKSLKISKKINESFFKIQDQKKLKKLITKIKPNFIFHLAAQALVKRSYNEPVTTWDTNLFGTLSLLESLRNIKFKKELTVVIITSDKSYKNLELKRGYIENDVLGGEDPYSASKGAVEILINSYIKSFFLKSNIKFAIARAGNVIGGGDWSKDRLIPDCVRSWSSGKKVFIRNPGSTRPWQHVIEVLYGYLKLAYYLKKKLILSNEVFNFGPLTLKNMKVIDLVKRMKIFWKKVDWEISNKNKNHHKEANLLFLNSKKSKKKLKWNCIFSQKQTIKLVAEWYKNYYSKRQKIISLSQIELYESLLKNKNK